MKKKISVIGILIILCVLFLSQTSMVYAAKPESIYFFSSFGDYTLDDSNIIYNSDGLPWISQTSISGTMYTGFFPTLPFGDFTAFTTYVYHYDGKGSFKYAVVNQDLTITFASGDTLTIKAKAKVVFGVPLQFQRPGSWRIVGGTGVWGAVTGGGDFKPLFEYYGKIK